LSSGLPAQEHQWCGACPGTNLPVMDKTGYQKVKVACHQKSSNDTSKGPDAKNQEERELGKEYGRGS